MRTVMRLEHPSTGRGPYHFLHRGDPSLSSHPRMDSGYGYQPHFDRPECNPGHYKYGFVSVEQANRWWDSRAKLSAAKQGYKLAVYEVPENFVHADANQCVFEPAVAKLVAHIDPEAWLTGDLNMLLQAAKEQAQCGLPTADSLPSVRTSITKARPQRSAKQYSFENPGWITLDEKGLPVSELFSASAPSLQQIPRSRGQ